MPELAYPFKAAYQVYQRLSLLSTEKDAGNVKIFKIFAFYAVGYANFSSFQPAMTSR